TMLVPEAGPGARVFPADLSRFLVDYYRAKGVELRTQEGMAGLGTRGGKCVVRTTTQGELVADVIVAGLGIQPSVELAEQAGLLGGKRWRTGRRHFGKVWSTTSRTGACAASCCGTPGGRSITRAR